MHVRLLALATIIVTCEVWTFAQGSTAKSIDAYLQPYVQSGNFSGDVLVKRGRRIVFRKSYGFANREQRIANTGTTRFHIASMSMQFTAAAALRLVDKGLITLDEPVSDFTGEVDRADKITIRNLLTERSGLPDINALPNYDDLLEHHQTPSSLVAAIAGQPLLFDPGTKFLHEEHSAYNLLAFIIERKRGLPFAAALKELVFRPIGLGSTGIDDDSVANAPAMAKGYQPIGTYGLRPAQAIHWSGKTGNASAYSTVGDEAKWVDALFGGRVLSPASRDAALDTSTRIGYGWFKGENQRLGQTAYYMNGRSPGFGSFLLYLPRARLLVILLGNIYSAATTTIGNDIAALSLGLPYEKLAFKDRVPGSTALKSCEGTFQFGPDFYQANARVSVIANGGELSLRWPSGDISPLLPLDRDRFLDRSYWENVRIERDAQGIPRALVYDRFKGDAVAK